MVYKTTSHEPVQGAAFSVAWQLFVDGAARNNPGPAGAGIYIIKDKAPAWERGFYLGNKTNNQAEYLALLLGVYLVVRSMKADDTLIIKSDSELLVRQMKGVYRIKNRPLALIHARVKEILGTFRYDIAHIPREENKIADKLANKGIDNKIIVPLELLAVWPVYEDIV